MLAEAAAKQKIDELELQLNKFELELQRNQHRLSRMHGKSAKKEKVKIHDLKKKIEKRRRALT